MISHKRKKRPIVILVCILLLVAVGYIVFMAMLEGPIRLDITDHAQINAQDATIVLPWYLKLGIHEWGKNEGMDSNGVHYTCFSYELPSIFESAEMNCVVCWEKGTAIAYIGESRAMDIIDVEYMDVQWK